MSFPVFDRPGAGPFDVLDTLDADGRAVIAHLGWIEPLDVRDDTFKRIRFRSTHTAGLGPTFELGPFELGTEDALELGRMLLEHFRHWPSEFPRPEYD